MTREQVIDEIKRAIFAELHGTIPPSIDIMRDSKFERAAIRALVIAEKYGATA